MKLCVVVPLDLKMSGPKVASQVGHAAMAVGVKAERAAPNRAHPMLPLLVLQCADARALLKLMLRAETLDVPYTPFMDYAPTTEGTADRFTAVAFGPCEGALLDRVTGRLELLGARKKKVRR